MKPKCFGSWLDCDIMIGYPKCRTCNHLKECQEKYEKDLDAEAQINDAEGDMQVQEDILEAEAQRFLKKFIIF